MTVRTLSGLRASLRLRDNEWQQEVTRDKQHGRNKTRQMRGEGHALARRGADMQRIDKGQHWKATDGKDKEGQTAEKAKGDVQNTNILENQRADKKKTSDLLSGWWYAEPRPTFYRGGGTLNHVRISMMSHVRFFIGMVVFQGRRSSTGPKCSRRWYRALYHQEVFASALLQSPLSARLE